MSEKSVLAPSASVRQNANVSNEPIVEEEASRDRRFKLVEHFQKLNPPSYAGIEGPEAAEEFLNRAKKIFDLLGCTSEEKVIFATYSLQREADTWWNVTREYVDLDYTGNAWERFRQAFLDKYFPFTVREDKEREFELFQQTEGMTVNQYEAKFSKLSRHAPKIVDIPLKRARKFERGLLPRIQNSLAVLMLINYEELYRRAQHIEKIQRECDEREHGKEKRQAVGRNLRTVLRGAKRGRLFRKGETSNSSQCERQDYYGAVAAEVNYEGIYDVNYQRSPSPTPSRPKMFEDKDQMEFTEILKLRGLPFTVKKSQILEFFKDFQVIQERVHIVRRPDGKATGDAFVEFATSEEASWAMAKDKMTIGSRYVELFPATQDEAWRAESRSRQ